MFVIGFVTLPRQICINSWFYSNIIDVFLREHHVNAQLKSPDQVVTLAEDQLIKCI